MQENVTFIRMKGSETWWRQQKGKPQKAKRIGFVKNTVDELRINIQKMILQQKESCEMIKQACVKNMLK